jgi:hypothetical protein
MYTVTVYLPAWEQSMKAAAVTASILLAALPTAASAGPNEEAVKAVIKTVKRGEDLGAAYPDAISAKETASLRRVSKCSAINLMKQERGRYTVVWNCGAKGALGMEVRVVDARVTSISTMELVFRPHAD